jgi:K(+)-stimulated pyrophosphate-energized sodium pump
MHACSNRPAVWFRAGTGWTRWLAALALLILAAGPALAQDRPHGGGEASLVLPDFDQAQFFGGIGGRALLMSGLLVCALGLAFGLATYTQLRNLPVHASMREVSELIYETCKTYLITQGKFLMLLEIFIGAIIVFYFGLLLHFEFVKVLIILFFSMVGIAGSYAVAWFGARGHQHRDAADQRRAADHADHPAVRSARLRRPVLHRIRHR